MKTNRWFAWTCLALLVVSEAYLFYALREKDFYQTELRNSQAETWRLRQDLEALKNSNAGMQAAEILRLRKQNEFYSTRLDQAESLIALFEDEVAQSARDLDIARTALKMQQEHLQELQVENRLVADAGLAILHRNNCINNLRMIDAAKTQWALDKNKNVDAVPTVEDLVPYLKDGVYPTCPDQGVYSIRDLESLPVCTFAGHVLPQ